ncbi:MAG: ankyrin repeat domain-containing protein [Polyangiaceae bacterium]|nr:ankyrin repeat domain-containing protein [Polyangiaceae bacterium]
MAENVARPGELKKKLPKEFERKVDEPSTKLGELRAVFDEHDVNARGGYGDQTALMMCRKNVSLARWLLDRGADVHAVDQFGYTALHEAASHGTRAVMLALLEHGASMKPKTLDGDTPLHCAADARHLDGVRILLEHGAAVAARNYEGLTPLELGLENCANADLVEMVPVAEALLKAGAKKSRQAGERVAELAATFEFHKAEFDPDSVEQTAAAMGKLCRMFGVPPRPTRKMHDGQSKITVKSRQWQKQHAELWDLLVPGSGPARTVQGEVIRISGRIADEMVRNGGINWDKDYAAMGKALLAYLASPKAVDGATLADCRKILAHRPADTDTDRLSKAAVAWVLANPMPKPLRKLTYRR